MFNTSASEKLKSKEEPKRYIDPIFENVTVQKDILFDEVINFKGETEKLHLDIYTPDNDTQTNRPVILWIHGGGFRIGNDKSQSYIVKMATEFAKRGYVCISIDYRVRTNPREDKPGTLTQALEDAMSGLNWIRENRDDLKIDKSKIIVGGGSAGGILAVNLCYKDQTDSEKWDKRGIVGLINLWGSPDESYTMFEIDKKDPPTIIVHGTSDELVPYNNSVFLTNELEKKGVKNKLVTIEGAGHTPVAHMNDFIMDIAEFIFDLH
jgi:acetyl esterase/lipase